MLRYFGLSRRISRVSMYSTMALLNERYPSKHEFAGRYVLLWRNGTGYCVELWAPWEWV